MVINGPAEMLVHSGQATSGALAGTRLAFCPFMGRALFAPASGVTAEHIWWLGEIRQGRTVDLPERIRLDLTRCGYIEADDHGALNLTPTGERFLRMSSVLSSRRERFSPRRENVGRDATSREGEPRSRRRS